MPISYAPKAYERPTLPDKESSLGRLDKALGEGLDKWVMARVLSIKDPELYREAVQDPTLTAEDYVRMIRGQFRAGPEGVEFEDDFSPGGLGTTALGLGASTGAYAGGRYAGAKATQAVGKQTLKSLGKFAGKRLGGAAGGALLGTAVTPGIGSVVGALLGTLLSRQAFNLIDPESAGAGLVTSELLYPALLGSAAKGVGRAHHAGRTIARRRTAEKLGKEFVEEKPGKTYEALQKWLPGISTPYRDIRAAGKGLGTAKAVGRAALRKRRGEVPLEIPKLPEGAVPDVLFQPPKLRRKGRLPRLPERTTRSSEGPLAQFYREHVQLPPTKQKLLPERVATQVGHEVRGATVHPIKTKAMTGLERINAPRRTPLNFEEVRDLMLQPGRLEALPPTLQSKMRKLFRAMSQKGARTSKNYLTEDEVGMIRAAFTEMEVDPVTKRLALQELVPTTEVYRPPLFNAVLPTKSPSAGKGVHKRGKKK